LCVFHSATTADKCAAGRRAGGKTRSKPRKVLEGAPDVVLSATSDVADFLTTTISQVRRGQLDTKIANCLGLLAGQVLRALEAAETSRLKVEIDQLRKLVEAISHDDTRHTQQGAGENPGEAGGDSWHQSHADPLAPGPEPLAGGDDTRQMAGDPITVPLFPHDAPMQSPIGQEHDCGSAGAASCAIGAG
jgi:hypothetical protein